MTIAGPNKSQAMQLIRRPGWRVLLLFAIPLLSAGCTIPGAQGVRNYLAYNDTTNDLVLGWRNSAWASRAWNQRRSQFYGQPHLHAFGEGFRAGYVSVASGGTGCPPALPPRKFWSWRYQSPEGQAKVAAWFAAFPYGAAAAAEEGAGNWQTIQVAPNVEAQYSPEFMCPVVPGFEEYYPHNLGAPPGVGTGELLPPGAVPAPAPAAVPSPSDSTQFYPTTQPANLPPGIPPARMVLPQAFPQTGVPPTLPGIPVTANFSSPPS